MNVNCSTIRKTHVVVLPLPIGSLILHCLCLHLSWQELHMVAIETKYLSHVPKKKGSFRGESTLVSFHCNTTLASAKQTCYTLFLTEGCHLVKLTE